MRISATIAALALLWLGSLEASPWRSRTYRNSTLTVLAMTQDRNGVLWLAASNGLYRFDGFHYQKIQEYPFPSARFVGATEDGSIWAGDYEGLVRWHEGSFQTLLGDGVVSMAVFPDQVFVRLTNFALMRIKLDGTMKRISFPVRRDLNIDSRGRLWGVCMRPDSACWIDPAHPENVHTMALAPGYQAAVADAEGNVWVATDTLAGILTNGRPVRKTERRPSREGTRAGPLVAGSGQQLWILGDKIHRPSGEVVFEDTADNEPLCGFQDRRGHLWMWLAGRGLVELIADPTSQRWPSRDFAGEILDFIIRDQHGGLVLATHKNLYRFDRAGQRWIAFGRGQHRYDGLVALENGEYVASIRGLGVARLAADGVVKELLAPAGQDLEDPHFRKVLGDAHGRIWVAAKRGLFRVEASQGSLRLRNEFLPGMKPEDDQQAVDLELDREGRLWVGYMQGVAWLDDHIDNHDVWHRAEGEAGVMAVRSLSPAGNDIWVAHRRPGAITRMSRGPGNRWTVHDLTATAGYLPGDTEFIQQDSRGWIWRGTPEGVFVADGQHFEPDAWIHLSTENGLASDDSNQYGFLEDEDGTVWLVAEQGLTHLRPAASWFAAPAAAPKPYLTRFEVDGQKWPFPLPPSRSFPGDVRLLRVEMGSLDTPPFRDAPLRYRLRPALNEWKTSKDGTLEFHDLRAGKYQLEIGYTGQGPSPVAIYSLVLGNPPAVHLSLGLWLFLLGAVLTVALIPPVLRLVPAFAVPSFRLEKALFVLRRRFSARRIQSPERGGVFVDHTGDLLFGRYRLERVVSQGGFSVVYEAHDLERDGMRCAVKVVMPSPQHQGWVRDRFAHEVASLRTVNHANIVEILDSWISPEGEPCIAMPYLDGPTLRLLLKKEMPDPRRIARWVEEIAAGLAAVHARGIVHRDLKPENMIVLETGTDAERPVIIDFGTASMRTREDQQAVTTLMSGSFHYMAPERLSGHFSPASDIFSFAVVILEMLTGERLFEVGTLHSDSEFQRDIEAALEKALSTKQSARLAETLVPAFDPEPRKRPRNAASWAAEIAQILRGAT